jgi:putative phage shock protein E
MKKNIIIVIVIIAVLICIGCFIYKTSKTNKTTTSNSTATTNAAKTNEIRHVSMDDIVKIMNENKDYVIVDVRTPDEYKEGHIPNAINIPNETINETVYNKLKDKNQLILIYCRSGSRSRQAAYKMQKLGYTNLVDFGGIINWKGKIEK